MQVLVTPDPLGGERFTNRKNGKHCTLLAEPEHFKNRHWFIFSGGHPIHNLDRGPMFATRRGAVNFIEALLK